MMPVLGRCVDGLGPNQALDIRNCPVSELSAKNIGGLARVQLQAMLAVEFTGKQWLRPGTR